MFVRCLSVLVLLLSVEVAYGQAKNSEDGYFQFNILYTYVDGHTYENFYYVKENELWSYNGRTTQFTAFPGGILPNDTGIIGRLNTEAGVGVRFRQRSRVFPGYPVQMLNRKLSSSNILDSSDASVIALGIHPGNAHLYEYRILINNETVWKDWSGFSQFAKVPETGYRYAVIGSFRRPGSYLLIEIRNKQTQQDAGSVVLNWPRCFQLSVSNTRIYFKEDNQIGTDGYLDAGLLKKGYASAKAEGTGVLKDLRIPGDKEYLSVILDLNQMELTFPYRAKLERQRNGILDTVEVNYYFNEKELRIPGMLIDKPGKYRLLVGCTYFFDSPLYKQWVLAVPFEILKPPALSRKWTIKQALPYALGVFALAGILFYLYYRMNRQRVRRIEQEKQLQHLQLRSLQDQLNPHFLFNALGAIQNLIGKNDTVQASRYLDRFSVLTRTILANSHRDIISLEDEWSILQRYLEMEQLRTAFHFSMMMDDSIPVSNIEIPVMLLQPFVENAVKHGVTGTGMIRVEARRVGTDLVFSVSDNGKGMNTASSSVAGSGWGLQIVNERVRLLNEMYGEELVRYSILSDHSGTRVEIRLKGWLS
ncbi:MAG TPA: histidine kinase [Chitinophagaceae bacterium]|nr:histidine kinase [Chitinophagaceae bacterium]